jgi:hypothetical protein
MKTMIPLAIAAVVLTAAVPYVQAQTNTATAPSASSVGAGSSTGSSGTVGTGGSGAAGGTSASTLGLGGTSTGPAGTSSTIGGGGSAATTEGKATTSNKINENDNMLKDQAKAKAQDGGTWSKSMTDTKIKQGELDSRTKSMAHEPGGPPAKSTTTQSVPVTK